MQAFNTGSSVVQPNFFQLNDNVYNYSRGDTPANQTTSYINIQNGSALLPKSDTKIPRTDRSRPQERAHYSPQQGVHLNPNITMVGSPEITRLEGKRLIMQGSPDCGKLPASPTLGKTPAINNQIETPDVQKNLLVSSLSPFSFAEDTGVGKDLRNYAWYKKGGKGGRDQPVQSKSGLESRTGSSAEDIP
jgi:hypothetical protein